MKSPIHSSQKGQDLVEFALVFPLLIFMVVLILDLGRAVYYYSTLHNAAREAARYGVVHIPAIYPCDGETPVSEIYTLARSRAIGVNPDPSFTDVIVSCPDKHTIVIGMTHRYTAATPFTVLVLGSNEITIRTQSTMKLEQ